MRPARSIRASSTSRSLLSTRSKSSRCRAPTFPPSSGRSAAAWSTSPRALARTSFTARSSITSTMKRSTPRRPSRRLTPTGTRARPRFASTISAARSAARFGFLISTTGGRRRFSSSATRSTGRRTTASTASAICPTPPTATAISATCSPAACSAKTRWAATSWKGRSTIRTQRTVNGQIVRDPFPGNKIPVSRFDPIAVKVQNLLPSPDPRYAGLLSGNFEQRFKYRRIEQIYSWKVDHNLTENAKLAVYVGMQRTRKDNGQDGLPDTISKRRDQPIATKTIRINYDHALSPTLINHLGVGYQRYYNPDTTPITDYDSVKDLGLPGALVTAFPRFTGLAAVGDLGPTNFQLYTQDKPTVVDNLT